MFHEHLIYGQLLLKKKPQHFNTDFVKIKKLNQKHQQQKTAIYCPLEACSKRSWFQSNLQLMVNGK